jgi:hypothetical protein
MKLCHLQKMSRTRYHQAKQDKPQSKGKIWQVVAHLWNLDLK